MSAARFRCKLQAHVGITGMGVALHGSGFILDPERAAELRVSGPSVIRGYIGGRDLLQVPRERYLIDFSGLSEEQARRSNPAAFQQVVDYVKPERDHNNRRSIRELWWRFGWERPLLRSALEGLHRYIGTTETAKHRIFQFIPGDALADHMVICLAVEEAVILGILSSRVHVVWTLRAGGTLEDRPRYNKTRCFDPFPFPDATEAQKQRIRTLAEELDAHRKARQALHPELTLTGMYNLLERLRRFAARVEDGALTAKEKSIHEQGLVSVLAQLHDELDATVLEAYGWSDLAPALVGRPGGTTLLTDKAPEQAAAEEALLSRLVALNAERAAEEARGLVRWLRPEFQASAGARPEQVETEIPMVASAAATSAAKAGWPTTLTEQVQAVRAVLAAQPGPATAEQVARRFKRAQTRKVAELLDTLAALGQVRTPESGTYAA